MADPAPIVYPAGEQPDVEVLVDDQWLPGEVRMVSWDDAGEIHHQIQYRPAGTTSRVIDTFTDDQIRLDTVDRSRGRATGYRTDMTTTPQEPTEGPEIVPSGDPSPISTPEPEPSPAVDEPTDRA